MQFYTIISINQLTHYRMLNAAAQELEDKIAAFLEPND